MASASGSGSKETTQQADKSDILKLSISSQDGNKVYFKVKPYSPLRKVFRDFCTRKNFDYDSTKFIYDGVQLRETQTPKMFYQTKRIASNGTQKSDNEAHQCISNDIDEISKTSSHKKLRTYVVFQFSHAKKLPTRKLTEQ
ncbi:hypothetical protein Fmac_029662 [Flemingia macrophylla]|uniref:Rad60/SUMO-like domain-containing protein n=1 Tax=Flemingia macrophylla TaxID=520843 RepID=A0ABD1LB97_9FABA